MFGGKGGEGVFQFLINQIPPHRVYIEGCLGMGAVLRNKLPAELTVGLEVNRETLDEFASLPEVELDERFHLVHGCGVNYLSQLFSQGDTIKISGAGLSVADAVSVRLGD